MRNLWKWIGLAGLVGVAAGGVLVARDQRRRNSYSADEIRARLHRRLAEVAGQQRSDPGIRTRE
ncbi:hypothetical protein [Mycobacterium sp.]|jgi:hypothetical protein|uniref:hypothetical protein n=1 Tax=Mycobacterium sp. TaxID=1785 RepID=UPI002D26DADC|nr:hypothetical protein [Mycobacterium sp.]HZA11711.1 hypothetical protein [Mycobacterium sp.]